MKMPPHAGTVRWTVMLLVLAVWAASPASSWSLAKRHDTPATLVWRIERVTHVHFMKETDGGGLRYAAQFAPGTLRFSAQLLRLLRKKGWVCKTGPSSGYAHDCHPPRNTNIRVVWNQWRDGSGIIVLDARRRAFSWLPLQPSDSRNISGSGALYHGDGLNRVEIASGNARTTFVWDGRDYLQERS